MKTNSEIKRQQTTSTSPKLTGETGPRPSADQLNRAILALFDTMSRDPGLQFDYVMAGDTARCLHDNQPLDCYKIELVAPKKRATVEVLSMLRVWASPEANDKVVKWSINGIPVTLKFLENWSDPFRYADQRVYGPEFYKIPNQWAFYWENKDKFV